MRSKTITEDTEKRIYRTPTGAAVSCVIQHQKDYDPYDGQEAGYWGWCGPVDDQSDYALGPYESLAAVFAAYARRNPKHRRCKSVTLFQHKAPCFKYADGAVQGGEMLPGRKGKPCMLCHALIDVDLPVHHCKKCIEASR